MNVKKKYRQLEKSLEHKFGDRHEREVSLTKEYFEEGKLSLMGYYDLKRQTEYIHYEEDIEIKVPREYSAGFKDTLDYMGKVELSHIKHDARALRISASALLAIGVLIYVAVFFLFISGFVFSASDKSSVFFNGLFTIASWVFAWAGIERLVFGQRKLREDRFNLLQLLAAKVTAA